MTHNLSSFLYLVAAVLFILSLKGLSSPKSARMGNIYGITGMAIAVFTTVMNPVIEDMLWLFIAIGAGAIVGFFISAKIKMTEMPQLVAGFHSLVGLAAVFVACGALFSPENFDIGVVGKIPRANLIEMSLGAAIGAITFSGSLIAFAKLHGIMKGKPLKFFGQHYLNAAIFATITFLTFAFVKSESHPLFMIVILLSLALGFLLILPIGGADMPVVVSMLNSYSGWAASGIGFTLNNHLLIITGAIVGASGAILSYIMCKAMNRSIFNVIFGGLGDSSSENSAGNGVVDDRVAKAGSPEDAAFMMQNARSVIVVPGYGMAVAQAQHALKEMSDILKKSGVTVKYAIHPVAGRMPGHMNVLLAEANVNYEDVFELEDINREFSETDVAFVIGANDVTNPAAKTDPSSPIFGMPILDVENAKNVLFVKRSMSPGYAGVQNEVFFKENTIMLFGDAKKVVDDIIKAL